MGKTFLKQKFQKNAGRTITSFSPPLLVGVSMRFYKVGNRETTRQDLRVTNKYVSTNPGLL